MSIVRLKISTRHYVRSCRVREDERCPSGKKQAAGWEDELFIRNHTAGLDKVTASLTGFPIREALSVCGLDYEQVKEVRRLLTSRKSAIISDLGVLMNRHSALVSYLEEILLSITGCLDPDRNLDFVVTKDGRIHLHDPELLNWLTRVTPQTEAEALAPDPIFPLVMMAE